MFKIKDGVRIDGLQPEALFGMLICQSVFGQEGQEFVITSVRDGVHKSGSFHYRGLAFDIRTRSLSGISVNEMATKLRCSLGSQFQVIVEANHLHVEFDHG